MGKIKPMQDIAYTPEEARKLAKTVALGQMYGAGPKALKGLEVTSVIIDELSAIFGINFIREMQIHQLEDTKIKRLLYGKSDKTNI